MKKLSVIVFALLVGSSIYAQREGYNFEENKLNELKINLGTTIFGLFPEISYERVLDSDISVGASLGAGSSSNDSYSQNFAFTPYFRWHFGGNRKSMRKPASGFFIEANGSLFSQEQNSYDYGNDTFYSNTNNKFGAGMGLALGWKYVSKNNWVGELLMGGGRDFVNKDEAYPRFGISIGKRF